MPGFAQLRSSSWKKLFRECENRARIDDGKSVESDGLYRHIRDNRSSRAALHKHTRSRTGGQREKLSACPSVVFIPVDSRGVVSLNSPSERLNSSRPRLTVCL